MEILLGILEQGLTYAFLALGLYFAYIILDFPDLTVDGSFPLGAAVSVSLSLAGLPPLLTLVAAALAGAAAGLCTGLIHVKLRVKDLLAGLIMQTALYTVNLMIAGRSNVPIFDRDTLFQNTRMDAFLPPSLQPLRVLIMMLPLVILIKLACDAFLSTQAGFLLKAAGDKPSLVCSLAHDPGMVKVGGLALANALVALSGACVAQEQRFFEISMGTGAMLMGLASVILGLKLLERFSRLRETTKVLLGSVIYKAVIAFAITLGLPPNALKLLTALTFLVILVAGNGQMAAHFRRLFGLSKACSDSEIQKEAKDA